MFYQINDRTGFIFIYIIVRERYYENMAGVLGIEPRVVVLETTGLPLTDTPIMSENTLRQKQLISLTLFFLQFMLP